MGDQAVQPGKLVVEFGSGLRVSVWSIDRGDKHAIDGRLEVPGLPVGGAAWQLRAGQYRRPPREDRHAVPAPLAAEYHVIARLPDCFRRELGVRSLQFLKADSVGFRFAKPVKQVGG